MNTKLEKVKHIEIEYKLHSTFGLVYLKTKFFLNIYLFK